MMEYLTLLPLASIMFALDIECRPIKQKQEENPYTDINKQNEFLRHYEGLSLNSTAEDLSAGPDPGEREAAIRRFQHYAGLPVTGTLDEESIAMMNRDRCGVADPPDMTSGYNVFKKVYGWEDGIEYYYSHQDFHTLQLTESEVWDILQQCADKFNAVTTNLQIRPLADRQSVKNEDFEVYFGGRWHSNPADPGDSCHLSFGDTTLAHAFYPQHSPGATGVPPIIGDMHFNSLVTYGEYHSGGTISFPLVALHEMGHSLGLGHSNVWGSVMGAYYRSYLPFALHQDDIDGIINLYGLGPTSPTTSTTTSSTTTSSTATSTSTSSPDDVTTSPRDDVTLASPYRVILTFCAVFASPLLLIVLHQTSPTFYRSLVSRLEERSEVIITACRERSEGINNACRERYEVIRNIFQGVSIQPAEEGTFTSHC